MDSATFFATDWPRTAARLSAMLSRHGVAACDLDDVLQETALRLCRSWHTIDQSRSVEAFARTVALNVLRDERRKPARRGEVLGEVPEAVDGGDTVERTALARLELQRVRRAVNLLRPSERIELARALASDLNDERTTPTAASVRMARMRARRALVALLRAAGAAVLGLVGTFRRSKPGRVIAATVAGVAVIAVAGAAPAARPAPAIGESLVEPVDGPSSRAVHRRGSLDSSDVRRRDVTPMSAADAPGKNSKAARRGARVQLPGAGIEILVDVDLHVARVHVRDRGEQLPLCVESPPLEATELSC